MYRDDGPKWFPLPILLFPCSIGKGAANNAGRAQFFFEAHSFKSNIKEMFLAAEKVFKKVKPRDADRGPVCIIFGESIFLACVVRQ